MLPRRRVRRAITGPAAVAGAVLAVQVGALLVAPAAQAAPWQDSASRSAVLGVARLASELRLTAGSGSVTPDAARYSLSTTLSAATGYVDLVNTSGAAAVPSVTVTLGSLVAATPVTVCTQPWNTVADTCPGTPSTVGLSRLVGSQSGTYTAPAPLAPGEAAYLRLRTSGVAGQVTVVTNPVLPRPGTDRTSA
ncbi:hypothetical protein TEK04_11475 [Klenkia sp. LSe6-5]|uniref:Uncharacterized protein n=1 Tax=Klenkia sesuvii TaxID=3103137 RepID=A0ABU8DWB4_9ACTN